MNEKETPITTSPMSPELEALLQKDARCLQLLRWFDEASTPVAQAELDKLSADIDWPLLTLATVDQFLTKVSGNEELVEALRIWKHRGEQAEARANRETEHSKRLSGRRRNLESALGLQTSAPLRFSMTENNQVRTEVELLHSIGLVVHRENMSDPFRPSTIQDPLVLCTEAITVELRKATFYRVNFEPPCISFRGVNGRITLNAHQAKHADLFLLVSREVPAFPPALQWPSDDSQIKPYVALESSGWRAEVRLNQDPRLLFDRAYLDNLSKAVGSLSITSVTVTGDRREQFALDDLATLLFFLTGNEFRQLEAQELADDETIISLMIHSSRPKNLVNSSFRMRHAVEPSDVEDVFNRLMMLPAHGPGFSRRHFRILNRAIQVGLQSPIEKTLIDLYQVLDTVAGLHPNVPRTNEPKEAFEARKKVQRALIESIQGAAFTPHEDAPKASTDDALRGLAQLIGSQRNELGVTKRIKKLLDSIGLPYNSSDETDVLALNLRNRISHNLASIRVSEDGDDGYPLQALVKVRERLLYWSRRSLLDLLQLSGVPSDAAFTMLSLPL